MARKAPTAAIAAASACVLGLWGAGVSGALEQAEKLETVGPGRAGEILLGDSVKALHKRHLIGRLRPGCELDPGQRVARLRPPLEGLAIFSHPRNEVSSLVVEGGAETTKGIGIGSTAREAQDAYPKAEYNPPGTYKPFAEGFLWVNRSRQPRMTFVIDPKARRVSSIGVPAPSFCE